MDGFYLPGTSQWLSMNDIKRVEVVKGPQSAFFGRATFGGAINFISKTPGDDFNGDANLILGDNGRADLTRISHQTAPCPDSLLIFMEYPALLGIALCSLLALSGFRADLSRLARTSSLCHRHGYASAREHAPGAKPLARNSGIW